MCSGQKNCNLARVQIQISHPPSFPICKYPQGILEVLLVWTLLFHKLLFQEIQNGKRPIFTFWLHWVLYLHTYQLKWEIHTNNFWVWRSISCVMTTLSNLKSLTSEATPLATQFFKRSYKISCNPGLSASWDALPSFASSTQSAKIGLKKWILYVKNNLNLHDFFSLKNKILGAHFLLKYFLATSISRPLFY